MSGEIDDVLQGDGWHVDGLGGGGDLSNLNTSGEVGDVLGAARHPKPVSSLSMYYRFRICQIRSMVYHCLRRVLTK